VGNYKIFFLKISLSQLYILFANSVPLSECSWFWPLKAWDCTFRRRPMEFKWRAGESATVFRPISGLLRHTQERPGIIKSRRYFRSSRKLHDWSSSERLTVSLPQNHTVARAFYPFPCWWELKAEVLETCGEACPHIFTPGNFKLPSNQPQLLVAACGPGVFWGGLVFPLLFSLCKRHAHSLPPALYAIDTALVATSLK
jgi:hypothetical protein